MTQIVPLICQRMVADLTKACITDLQETDPTRANVVQWGRYRDEPIIKHIYAAVIGGDPDDPTYKDGAISLNDMDNIGFRFPLGEIGGLRMWWRRGVIQLGCYFINQQYAQDIAAGYAYAALGRIEHALTHIYVGDLSDGVSEKAIKLFCYGNSFSESGGPPKSYIWRGKIYWSCLTQVEQA